MPTINLTEEQVIELVAQLSPEQRLRVLELLSSRSRLGKRPIFGSAKDDIIRIAPDFDAPLDDFRRELS